MFNPKQFRNLIERVLSQWPELYSEAAVEILLGTAAQESSFGYNFRQLGGGPGIGFFQMEPHTYLWLQEEYGEKYGFENRIPDDLEWDLRLAILLARLRYRILPQALPVAGDLPAMAAYWNKFYNANPQYGTDEEFINNYRKYVSKDVS